MVHRIVLSLVFVVALAAPAMALPFTFRAFLSGPGESPPNASPGTGIATVTIDAALHTMAVDAQFTGLTANNTAAHIHVINGPGDTNTADTLGPVATTTPTFAGFPFGTAGSVPKHPGHDAGEQLPGRIHHRCRRHHRAG